jgi:ribonuclease Z
LNDDFTGEIFEDAHLSIRAYPVKHRIPTFAYVFEQKGITRKINMEAIAKYEIPNKVLKSISQGMDYTDGDRIIPNEVLTIDPPANKRYAFVTDTDYWPEIANYVQGVNLLYHEATFTEEYREKARETKHTTAREAAQIALKGGVKQLVIGHYSSRYGDLTPLLSEARAVFEATVLAIEGTVFEI